MNKEETLALWRQGKDAWNAWAHQMLARRAEMEQAGTWAASRDLFGKERPENAATAAWMREAAADLDGHPFTDEANFSKFLFPGFTSFKKAHFQQGEGFQGATFRGRDV